MDHQGIHYCTSLQSHYRSSLVLVATTWIGESWHADVEMKCWRKPGKAPGLQIQGWRAYRVRGGFDNRVPPGWRAYGVHGGFNMPL